jgi:amino acid adenylation domain-containing protein
MEKLTEETCPDSLPDWSFSVLRNPRTLLHEAFEAQVDRAPGALAVAWEGERLSFRELDERSNRLAAHLRALGVGPEVPVGVCVERSANLIVALLATLKAGGAYVPLDPAYPVQRNTYTLDDSGAKVVLTQTSALASLPPLGERRAVLLDEQAAEIASRPAARLERLSDPSNLAYFIYTSGSTGRPKGVAIEHHSVVSLMRWCAEFFSPDDVAGVLASTSICFDISIFEMFAPLCLGGTMIVATNVLDVPYLRPDPPVTLISTVPSAMAELVRTRRVPPSARVTNLGGEALPGSLVEEIYRTTGIERVYNVYGPSEDTTYSTYALIPRDCRIAPPVGDPLPGTAVWLLDAEGTPVPFGQEGEVHLTGAGISRGYHGRPELTAERFLPDPFSGQPGARMYRVGDLGRFLPDGQLHYVGRIDFQVKIRGFRIELGEVEDALMRHPAVREAAVMARGEVAEGKYLVAWLAVDGPMPEIAELRSFLGLTLPGYMIPSRFVRVDALPRTLNGKVDRKALPDSEAAPSGAPAREGAVPLSFAQQRLWFLDRLQTGEPAYNEPAAFDLGGAVDRAALAAALGEVVRRHQILRTRYVETAGTPFQEVAAAEPLELPLVDLSALPGGAREAALEEGLRREVRRPFDLGRAPLLRAVLFRRGEGEHTLSLTVHHIAYDGRSKQILSRELSALYAAARAGRPPALPAPAVQYGDLARLQRESWRGVPPRRLAEWRRLLEGVPALALPADRPRPAARTWRGLTVRFEVPADQAAALRLLARGEGASSFKALLTVFAALLGRAADRADGVLGTTAAGRVGPESRDLIGFFVNLLPLRLDLSGRPSLRGLLARVRATVDDAAAAQEEVPFEQLVAALQPERSAGRDALFEVLFQLHPPLALPELEGLSVRPRPVDTGTAKFDLETTLLESGGALEGFCQASADLYDRATVDRFAGWFRALLGAAAASPDLPLEDFPLFSEAERLELAARRRNAGLSEAAGEEPPSTRSEPIERVLAQVWCEVLGLAAVAPADDFFHLGGHSLLGVRVLSQVRETFGVDLPVQALFRTPTLEGLAGAVAEALRAGLQAPPPVAPAADRGRLPLSFAQERFWYLDRLRPGGAVYNVPLAFRLAGGLDAAALEGALGEIVRRHEALRTRFAEGDGAPFQEVAPAAGPALVRIDLEGLPPAAREEELRRLTRVTMAEPFDLSRGPLLRARLARLGAADHALLLCFHHAVLDGWSAGLFNRELSALYAAAREGRPSPLPEPPVQYGDYAAWQRSWLTGEVRSGLLDWWRRELAGACAELELPADRPRPEVQSFRGAVERTALPAGLAAALAELARGETVTPFMVLLAAFQTLVWRLTGEEDFLVGTPSANRPRPELEGVVGLFLETLALRGRLGGDPPFRGLLARVRETALRAFTHQDLPFEHLVAGLGVERSAARSPLIQTLFSLQAAPEEGVDLPGLAVRLLDPETATSRLDLGLTVEETGGGLRAALEYDAALFEPVTARRFLARFITVLEGALADPGLPLSDLPLLAPAERHQLLTEWSHTASLPGARVYVLDEGLRLLPAGVPGELAIGDLAEAAETAETADRYMPDPFSATPGARLYLTGDLARRSSDGAIEILGRAGHPEKPRGRRLEPARVPAAAAVPQAPSTPEEERISRIWAEALGLPSVGVRDDFFRLGGHSLLAAGVLARIRQELGADLPLQAFLRQPTVEGLAAAVADTLPPARTAPDAAERDLAARVAGIWAQVLGLPSVAPDGNFFELGGHSLLGARVLARIHDLMGVDLPLRALFRTPTVEGLAGTLAEALRSGAQDAPPPLVAGAFQGERLPLSFAQERFWLLDRMERGAAVYNIPLAYALEGELSAAALEGALREIVRRHQALRTRFAEESGAPFQEVLPPSGPDLPRIDLGGLPEAARRVELERVIREEAAGPFDLGRGPLPRVRLVHLGGAGHALLATFHHAVFDGWSQELFERELSALYAAALEGSPSPLPELPLQYVDYARWQRGWLTAGLQEELLAWWQRELAGAPVELALPTDRPRPEMQASRGSWERLDLSPELAGRLTALGRGEHSTRFMVLLTAWQALLGALSGQEDLLVGSPAANRPRPELEGLIGLFVETVVVRARLGGDPTFRELLAQVRESALEAFAHQDLPFERLVAGLRLRRSSARNPLIQALFALEEAKPGLSLPGIDAGWIDSDNGTSKFDLSLFVKETGGGLRADLEYDSDLFDPATIRRFLSHFAALLEAAAADPGRRLSGILPLSAAERRQAIAETVERIAGGLAAPAPAPAAPAGALRLPAWEVELVARIWSELLGVPAVGPDDNFFHLGGHSLAGARMLARVHETLGIDLTIRELFRAPTVRALTERIAALRAERSAPVAPVRRAQGGLLPVSFVQESLWFLYLLDPRSPVYNIPLAWRLRGPLDTAALESAVRAVARRHEVLRASFVEVEGQPFLAVSPELPPLARIDLAGLPAAAREAELGRIAGAEAGAPFDLGAGPLLRARLAVLGASDHVLLVTLHHSVFDGSSQPVFGRELAAFYRAAHEGIAPALPELPIQYADFAAWQRDRLREPALEGLLAFWRDALAGAPRVLELPVDRPRPAVQTFRGAWETLEVPARLTGELLRLGRREGATHFMTLLAAFQTLLYRLTGQPDLLAGSPVANRSRPELEPLIGYFVDTVVLRGRFHGEDTFRQRIARARETALAAFSHQDLPFALLAADLETVRDPSRNPVFQVMVALDGPAQPLDLPGVAARPLSTAAPAAKFDLSLWGVEADGSLRLNLEYNLDLFDPGTARRILGALGVLLETVAADPGRRLDEIPLLSTAELRELVAGAESATLPPAPRRLHDLFAAQAARTPDALAVLTPAGERLTYAELAGRSRRIARFLVRKGVGPEVPVGVCLERSPELIATLLGVLEAGGVYLPLDPGFPAERLVYMLEDSGARLVLARGRRLEEIPAGDWEAVALESVFDGDGDGGAADPGRSLPESLAYLIYTSGSTGKPKGVGVPHTAAAEHFDAAAGLFGFREGDRMLWFSSPSFDMSLEEIFVPLARGGAVVLRDADLWTPGDFLEQAVRLGVTAVDMPTAYWHQWAAEADRLRVPADLPLRLVVLGGEAMSGEALRRWWRSPFAGIRLLNSYGPTEATVTATALAVDASVVESAGGTVPLGHPLPGRSAWVLDGFGHPAPAGAPGELCVGGPLLARGYLGRPGLTAERFVPDPFSGRPGSRLYRTGDLARLRRDGVLEFLGRADRQIKVRGFRVELGEVESALVRHPAVREAVVDARPDLDGQRLVAWIVPEGPAPSPAELAGFLRGTLPEALVPSGFLVLPELPLTSSGKVNLGALPDPEIQEGAEEGAAPRTPAEERMAGLWRELFGGRRFGVHDSFFALGGHSLLAIRLLSRIRDVFGVEVPVRALFSAPTIEALAALVAGSAGEPAGLPRLTAAQRSRLLPLSFSQRSLWLLERLQRAGAAYNLPTALRLGGPLDAAALAAALGRLVARHEALRTRFAEVDGEPGQEILPATAPPLARVDLSALPAHRREAVALALAEAEAARPFDLSAGPLLRAHLFRLGASDHLFLFVVHHAVGDGWSRQLMLQELGALYQAAAEGRPDPLPAPPLQFADYAAWQRRHLRGEALEALLARWRERLAGVPALELPTDHLRPAAWSFRGASRAASLDGVGTGMEELARDGEATPFMVFLAALEVLLGRHAGQSDFAVGTPTANRNRSELEGVVGFFVNMLPLRADLGGAPTFRELLDRVRATALDAFGHQELPFELMVEELAPERDLGRNPIFQVSFQLGYGEETTFPGLSARLVEVARDTAKFDLSFAVETSGGRFSATCEYAADLFEATTVRRLLDQLGRLLAGAVAEPDRAIGDLPLLSPAERHQVVAEWNDTEPSAPSGPSLLRRLDERTRRNPEALAVVQGDRRAAFGELEARAGRLAGRLRELGVGPETRVAVCLPRSIEAVVSYLAVWKAGGAYVPLDPSYPVERLEYILADSGAPVLIASGEPAAALAWPGVRMVDPGESGDTVEEGESPADALAYVIYTSGSTGRPKGVEVAHGSLLNLVDWHVASYGLGAADRATMLARTGFDASVWEIWPALAAGASLHLPDEEVLTDAARLRDWMVERGITVSFVPTPLAELMLDLPWPEEVGLRALLTGGDALHRRPAAGLPFRLVNHYGPTEATVVTTAGEVAPEGTGEDRLPPIGRPLPGFRVHVLDAGLRPQPAGVPGELYVGGAGLARGYRGQPGLTAERFLPDPFAARPGERLYRTGDRVRHLPSGELEFLGRLDFQVKVRGFRIELGEIEALLGEHPAVRQCAVAVLQAGGGDKRLVAYVAAPGPVTAEELRSFLAGRLPAYMVPAGFVLLPALPLDAHGKVDRRALERIAPPEERHEAASDAPRTPVEEALAAIWSTVLRVKGVGRGESFFSLGGHSLLVGSVLSRVRDAFGVDLPASVLFSAPTVAALAAHVESARGTAPGVGEPVHDEPRPERPPLSFSQRGLWLVERLQPAGGAYNLPLALRFGGRLDVTALATALGRLVERHPALRTRFAESDGEPWQEILPPSGFALEPVDLSALPKDRREERALALARTELARPFDLSAGPLLRASLYRLAEDDHLFLLVIHHAVSDGWSNQIILRDFSALYQAAAEGQPASLPALPLQYADYAVQQRRQLRGPALGSLLARWRERLAGVPVLDLPTDHRRPSVWSFRGAVRSSSLDAASPGLERLAYEAEVTPFMVLLATAQVLLGRYAGQSDFAIGTPTANRGRSELEDVVGFFVNMLPLRADLTGEPTFRALLDRVRATALEAFAHQGLPFELLVEELSPERDLGRNPVFQVALQLLYTEETAFPGLDVRQTELTGGAAKFDLNFFIERRGGRLSVACEYAADLFEATTIQRLLDQFELLLAGAITEPGRRIGDLPLLSPAERHHLLAEANDVPRDWPREATIHGLFEEAAARTPDAVAVAFEGRRLTYRELDAWSGRLAARLVALGVRPEDRVALLAERSLEMVVALLAVLKAGGAYAPIDPALPAERMAYLLGDLRPPVLLVQEKLRPRIPEDLAVVPRVVSLDGEPLPEETLTRRPFVTADSLAYVLYTSGSTGRPKGVACVHRGVVRLVKGEVGYADLGPERTLLQLTALTFDPSVMEIWGPLANGGKLVVFPPGVPTFEKLEEVIAGEGVDTVWLTTGLFHQVVDERPGALAPIRQLLAGGDVLSPSHVRRAIQVPPAGRVLVNGYGPTESTLFTTCQAMWSPGEVREPVAIGRPVNGTQVYVLDRGFRPVPFGVPGELYIGGDGLARCYDGRPDLTADRFVPSPFAGRPGERLYRTGDLVRLRPSGELDFLGRLDFQVKVRGFRIELGEIDATLDEHPAVQQSAVVVRQDARGDKHLVAYVAVPEAAATAEDLRSFLSGKLPAYMVPSTFVLLPALPLSAHGKVDRRALPDPGLLEERDLTAPRNPTEELLASLWSEVLGVERIGVHENFFAVGGHSLRAVQLVSRLRQAFGVDLGVHALFSSPTIAELAELIQKARGEQESRRTLPPVRPVPRGGLLPVSFPQQRLWFVERLAPDRATYNIPLSYRLRGRLYPAAFAAALGEVVRRHETLRTRFVELDGQPWQEILPPAAPFVLPVIDLAGLPEERRERELARVGRAESGMPFDLTAGLMRSRLIRLGEREHVFLITLHHIAFDGWSEEVLRRELSALYAAALTGHPAHLPEMSIQYADFAAWQRSWPEGVLAEQLAYWSRRLGGVATLEIPTDRPRPPVQTFRGGYEPFTIGPEIGRALHTLVDERGVTLFMVMLAGWQALLHRVSGQADVAVGSPVANRTRSEIEGLIGFFVNMLAFRTDFGGDPSFAEVLARLRRTALEAYDHADVPFERLVDELRLERDLSRNPVVQVMFALQNAGVEDLRLPGIALERLDFAVPVAKFDLTLWLQEEDEGGFKGWIEFNADLFDRPTMTRLAGHLVSVLEAVSARPEDPMSSIDLLTPHERRQILEEWNDTRVAFPETVLIHQFFEARVDRAPGALAAVWEDRSITYGGLEARSNRLARLLRQRGLERGAPVGVWMERSIDMLAGVLGVLKAGGYYLPLDPAWPAERVESILGTCEAPAILTRSAHLGPVLEMQWRLPRLSEVICLDVETPGPAPETVDAGGISAVFDLVAEAAVDRVTAGGFVSSYTGEPFSGAEVDEYRDRVLSLAEPWIGPEKRVLEIGSGSGLILWEIAPRVARAVGLDASALTQERNRERAAGLGLDNVELPVGFAHEIAGWPEGSFDLVILASTVQFFPGPLYLEKIVAEALRLLVPGGGLVIADVPDARRQEELRRTIDEQRALHGLPSRQDAPKILSLDEDLFRDLAALPAAGAVSVLHRETGFDNELGFRYDVVLTRDGKEVEKPRRKRLWTSWHVEEQAADRLPAVASPEDLAYIIHTSGSTGQPKGIAVQHRPVANLFAWLNPAFGIGPDDRVLFVTSLCFDLSVYDIFGLLAAGGCVHVASEDELRDAEALTRLLVEEPITLWDSAPAALVRLAPLFPAKPAAHSRLRRVMLSGDWIPVTLPDRVRAAFPHAVVTSLGGATEATVWSNWYPIGEVDPTWPSIPYGRPIDNARYHVLDAGLLPCPIGVPGDLYIGGEVLCVGYSHQPAVTAAAFLPDPFSGVPGARIYRTGDRARWFADGNLEFLGRVDQQVKIRGFRIELGEIEVALARHPEIREAVVLAREDVPGDKRLVAYVVPVVGAVAPAAGELREFLRHGLPDYMIPAAFVELDHLPVTANGKLDRRALPAPRWDHAEEGEEIELPVTTTERLLAGLWSEILGVDPVGRNDDFFDLGGHSLLATQLVARLREVFGAEVPLRAVFQAPSLADLAAEIDAIVAELAAKREDGSAPADSGPVLRPVPREGMLPLSASQLRQWFLVQLDPGSAAYNLPVTVQLDGDLRVDALAAALGEIVRRHEALRTTFDSAGGRPYAVIAPALDLPLTPPLPVADLSSLPEGEREAEARRLAGDDLGRPFDLVRGPLLRTTLIRLGAAGHVLAVTFHHIVFDGSSLGVFLRELAALYEAFAAGRPSPLPELPVQYVDYAAWQREWMEGPGLAGQLDYWKRQLASAPRVLDLPTDRPRPAVQSHEGRLMRLDAHPSLASGLKTLTSREGVTLFMAVLSGYATVLGRYTGQEDLNIGSFVANRRHEALERLIGFFVNTLVLRADLSGDPTFRELLARTREMTLDAFERQELPFEQLLDELQIERDPSRTPLFQAMIGVQNFAIPSIQTPGLALQTIGLTDKERSTTDLSLYLWEEDGVMTSWLEFSTDLFDAATMERLYGHIGTLLAAAEADPGLRLSELPLMPEAERRQVLDWSAGEVRLEAGRPVHERMREQARRAPGAPAVMAGGRVLTYGELDLRAGKVARGLRRLGVGPETVIGLCVDRSPEMIVGLFGILGAGAAYLPLDPGLPADRLVLLAGSSGVPVVLTRRELAPELPELPARLLRVDADFESESGEGLPEIATAPGSAAYVLYTSGSTGTPKGVVVEHRALGSFVEAAIATYGFNRQDRVLQFANLAFDTSAEEIYPCLAMGGALVLRDEEMLASPARFLATCHEAGVTVLDLPTAWWHELSAWVERERPALPAELRLIILGGERALPERVRGWLAATTTAAGGARPRLFNSYGPTEGTVVATACDLGATAPAVPIGRPLPGVEVYLLDSELRPVPAGVPGEICLGGSDLARGYLGRPDLTAERFVPSPFGPAGARLYRTGDLGRWRVDGQLDFAGRVDDQVKIRGFRIEPGEVAAALARHPAIQEAVVVAHEVRPGERELTAYAVPSRDPWPEVAELRVFLKEALPAYMIPSGLVLLGAMPRTATGKVDRRALPEPGRAARHDREYAAPETPTEEILAGIWQELLGVEPVGIYDNFFDLGGHSLLAPQVISRVGETFEIELPLRVLFEAPTIAQMANAVEQILLAQIEELSEEEIADLVGDEN